MKLECEHGTYEADTEKELLALARKGKRKYDAATKEKEARWEQARLKAEAFGFRIYDRIARQEGAPSAWVFFPAGHQHCAKIQSERGGDVVKYDRPEGHMPYDHYGHRLLGTVSNMTRDIVVFLRAISNGDVSAYALGSEGDSLALVELHGVGSDWFRSPKEVEATCAS